MSAPLSKKKSLILLKFSLLNRLCTIHEGRLDDNPPAEGLDVQDARQATHNSTFVLLNVGGMHFQTTRATLLKHESSFFQGLLSGNFSGGDDDAGRFFIDRSGKYFEPLLDYLRCDLVCFFLREDK